MANEVTRTVLKNGVIKETKEESKIQYYIDEEKRTIAAVMTDCNDDALKLIREAWDNGEVWSCIYFDYDNYQMANTYRGKATCNEFDIWNEEEGKRIARSRMLEKYYRAKAVVLARAIVQTRNILNSLDKDLEYAELKMTKMNENSNW